jgi:hypothetical protein
MLGFKALAMLAESSTRGGFVANYQRKRTEKFRSGLASETFNLIELDFDVSSSIPLRDELISECSCEALT